MQPVFLSQEQAIDYATGRACFRSGEIRILDSNGTVERIIAPVHIILSLPCVERKSTIRRVNYWNIIADNLDSLTKARL